MAKKRFYGVAGINGYGLYNDYGKVLESKPYIQGFMVKGFPYCLEAKMYAINTYKQLAYGATDINGSYEIKRMNRFYHKNPMRGQKCQGKTYKEKTDDNRSEKRIRPFFIGI